ncbi:anti-sigma factor [Paenibacillus sp. JX-17]|uniref:Regulator of SigK n=1 Tax=Paenibacillus lacisoli TaxID=3064525 RepID=A0ABT9CDG4_9BACL|nr:anti-sigma factor [Paenibacillus sp. JX-17]MDO7906684.1 anti-sigma factor [Paenibacillus sp. JX-17]
MTDVQEELAALYVLDALDGDEKEEFEKLLEQSEEARRLVAELREVTELLPFAAEEASPPAGMKGRVLGSILGERTELQSSSVTEAPLPVQMPAAQHQPAPAGETARTVPVSRGSRGWRWLSAGLAAAAILLGVYTVQLNERVGNLQEQADAAARQAAGLESRLAAAQQPAGTARMGEAVKLSPAAEDVVAQGLATIVIDSKGTHLVVQAENLPKLQGTEAYQVWLIKGDAKQSAGTFESNQGSGALYYTFEPNGYDTVAITLEPDDKGTQPRGKLILAAPVNKI